MTARRTLFWRIYPSYLLIIIAVLTAFSLFTISTVRDAFMAEALAGLRSQAVLLRKQIRGYLTPPDPVAVSQFCREMAVEGDSHILAALPDGRVIGDSAGDALPGLNLSERVEFREALRGNIAHRVRSETPNGVAEIQMAVPVMAEGSVRLVVVCRRPVSGLEARIGEIQRQALVTGLVVALLAAGLSYVISRRITNPIQALKSGVEQYARGDFSRRLPMPRSAELAMLVRAMNQMARELDERLRTVVRQRNELDAVLASMQDGVLAVDGDERVISANPAAGLLFQMDTEAAMGHAIQEVVRNADLHGFVRKALAGRGPADGEITLYQGTERILSAHSTPLLGLSGERLGTLIVFHDITRMRGLETMRRDFAANVSHEIKTPLTAIKGFVETLRSGALQNPDEAERFLEIIERHADRLKAIIDDLLKLAQIEQRDKTGGMALERHALLPVLRAAVETCRVSADEKEIEITLSCSELVETAMNPHFLEQAMVNLVDNAVKYSDQGGSVAVIGEQAEGAVWIRVADRGIGIPGKHLSRLFERFYRVDKSRSRKQGGTGLGLAIVKHIVQAHGGTITVESAVDRGSTFSIRLPVSGGRLKKPSASTAA